MLRHRWVRRAGIVSLACLGLTVGAVFVLNFFFFDWSVRKILNGASSRTGISVQFTKADGNLFTGRIRLTDASIVRTSHPSTTFDVRAGELAVDLNVRSMIWGDRIVESARAAGVRGKIERIAGTEPKPWYAKENIHIVQISITDVKVEWIDHTRQRDAEPMSVTLEIDDLTAQQLHTRWIAFGLLFQTTGGGRIAGKPFSVTNDVMTDGRKRTVWQFEKLPIELLADYVGGPIKWFTQGHAGVKATTLRGGPGSQLDMGWRFNFADVRAEVPSTLEGWQGRLAGAYVDYVNAHGEQLSLGFSFQLDRNGFDGAATPEAAGLWSAVSDAATKEVARALQMPQEQIEDIKQKAVDRLKLFRKKGESE